MSFRWLMTLLCVALLGLGSTGDALAQKTKSKGAAAPQTQTATQPGAVTDLDPTDAEELEEILAEADTAYFADSPDYEYAYKMYLVAAEAGSTYAMNRVGLMHDKGQYVEQSYAESFGWFMKAAEGGLPVGMSNVADMYYYGDGVAKDLDQAVRWYTRAADADYGYAMNALGNLYLSGDGVPEDREEAVYWFQQASDAGDPGGHWSLALRLLYGEGIDRDTTRAAELAYLALVNGHETALKEFKIIKDADTPPSFRRKVQELLKGDGFYSGAIDGDFGPSTIRAVEAAYESAL